MRWIRAGLAVLLCTFVFAVFLFSQENERAAGTGGERLSPAPAAQPAPKQERVEIIRVNEVKPGMKGYGLSVFQGTKIEKFDVEVMSVLQKHMGDKDIILVRVGHPVTDHANIIHGMSGSPVYLEGRLAGALALGFSSFPKDPLAGITPIEYMIADKDHPWEDENAFLRPLPENSAFRYCRTPLFVSGLSPSRLGGLREILEPQGFQVCAGSAGSMELAEDIRIEPGAAVGISLVRGDIMMDGVGTVTYVDGKDVLVFGHPMFQGGQVEMPMTTAYVHTVIADQTYSYKLSSVVKNVGRIRNDRLTSVYGVMGETAHMIPMKVEVENLQTKFHRTFQFEVAQHPQYTPMLISMLPDNCVEIAEAGAGKDTTIQYQATFKFEGFPPLELSDVYITSAMGGEAGGGFQPVLFQLFGNAFRKIRLERADVKMSIRHRRNLATIDGAWLETKEVKPGETLRLTVRLRPYDGELVKEVIDVPLPRTLPDGEYRINVMSGREAFGAADMRRMLQVLMSGGGGGMQREEVNGLEDILAQIRRRRRSDELLAQLDLPTIGVRYKDQKLENLPGSVFVNLVANGSTGLKVASDEIKIARKTSWVIEGQKVVRFQVKTPGRIDPDKETK